MRIGELFYHKAKNLHANRDRIVAMGDSTEIENGWWVCVAIECGYSAWMEVSSSHYAVSPAPMPLPHDMAHEDWDPRPDCRVVVHQVLIRRGFKINQSRWIDIASVPEAGRIGLQAISQVRAERGDTLKASAAPARANSDLHRATQVDQ